MSHRMEIAIEHWGTVPAWVEALISACDAPGASQNQVAKTLDVSQSVVSTIIRNDYRGSVDNIERRVRAILMPGEITCPALGPIGTADCLRWQDRASALNSAVPHVVRMYRACNTCPKHLREETDE